MRVYDSLKKKQMMNIYGGHSKKANRTKNSFFFRLNLLSLLFFIQHCNGSSSIFRWFAKRSHENGRYDEVHRCGYELKYDLMLFNVEKILQQVNRIGTLNFCHKKRKISPMHTFVHNERRRMKHHLFLLRGGGEYINETLANYQKLDNNEDMNQTTTTQQYAPPPPPPIVESPLTPCVENVPPPPPPTLACEENSDEPKNSQRIEQSPPQFFMRQEHTTAADTIQNDGSQTIYQQTSSDSHVRVSVNPNQYDDHHKFQHQQNLSLKRSTLQTALQQQPMKTNTISNEVLQNPQLPPPPQPPPQPQMISYSNNGAIDTFPTQLNQKQSLPPNDHNTENKGNHKLSPSLNTQTNGNKILECYTPPVNLVTPPLQSDSLQPQPPPPLPQAKHDVQSLNNVQLPTLVSDESQLQSPPPPPPPPPPPLSLLQTTSDIERRNDKNKDLHETHLNMNINESESGDIHIIHNKYDQNQNNTDSINDKIELSLDITNDTSNGMRILSNNENFTIVENNDSKNSENSLEALHSTALKVKDGHDRNNKTAMDATFIASNSNLGVIDDNKAFDHVNYNDIESTQAKASETLLYDSKGNHNIDARKAENDPNLSLTSSNFNEDENNSNPVEDIFAPTISDRMEVISNDEDEKECNNENDLIYNHDDVVDEEILQMIIPRNRSTPFLDVLGDVDDDSSFDIDNEKFHNLISAIESQYDDFDSNDKQIVADEDGVDDVYALQEEFMTEDEYPNSDLYYHENDTNEEADKGIKSSKSTFLQGSKKEKNEKVRIESHEKDYVDMRDDKDVHTDVESKEFLRKEYAREGNKRKEEDLDDLTYDKASIFEMKHYEENNDGKDEYSDNEIEGDDFENLTDENFSEEVDTNEEIINAALFETEYDDEETNFHQNNEEFTEDDFDNNSYDVETDTVIDESKHVSAMMTNDDFKENMQDSDIQADSNKSMKGELRHCNEDEGKLDNGLFHNVNNGGSSTRRRGQSNKSKEALIKPEQITHPNVESGNTPFEGKNAFIWSDSEEDVSSLEDDEIEALQHASLCNDYDIPSATEYENLIDEYDLLQLSESCVSSAENFDLNTNDVHVKTSKKDELIQDTSEDEELDQFDLRILDECNIFSYVNEDEQYSEDVTGIFNLDYDEESEDDFNVEEAMISKEEMYDKSEEEEEEFFDLGESAVADTFYENIHQQMASNNVMEDESGIFPSENQNQDQNRRLFESATLENPSHQSQNTNLEGSKDFVQRYTPERSSKNVQFIQRTATFQQNGMWGVTRLQTSVKYMENDPNIDSSLPPPPQTPPPPPPPPIPPQ